MAPSKADVASCIGKTRWSSEKAARYALASIRKRSDNRMDGLVRPYKCRACRRFHVGRGDWGEG